MGNTLVTSGGNKNINDSILGKRVKEILSNKFDQDIILRSNNVKKLARAELDKQEKYNYDTELELNLSKYKLGNEQEKMFYKTTKFSIHVKWSQILIRHERKK